MNIKLHRCDIRTVHWLFRVHSARSVLQTSADILVSRTDLVQMKRVKCEVRRVGRYSILPENGTLEPKHVAV